MILQAIHAKYDDEFSLIISSTKNLLAIHSDFEIKFVKCQTNSAAPLLDKAANFWIRYNSLHLIPS